MSMHVEPFLEEHLIRARELALQEWRKESSFLPELSAIEGESTLVSLLQTLQRRGIGFTLWEEETMIGYLAALASPYKTEGGNAIWLSPLGANCLPSDGTDLLLSALLERLPKGEFRLTRFLHMPLHENTLRHYGFVPDRVDALKLLQKEEDKQLNQFLHLFELPYSKQEAIRPQKKALEQFFASPPIFRHTSEEESEAWFKDQEKRIFIVEKEEGKVGFFALTRSGRNYLSSHFWSSYGLYVDPTLRGEGVGRTLVSYVSEALSSEGERYLGTDYNIANTGAAAFWTKAFVPYTMDYRNSK